MRSQFYLLFTNKLYCLFITLSFAFFIFSAVAKPSAVAKIKVERVENSEIQNTLVLPYAFSTDDLGFVLGVGGMVTGLHQEQMSVGGTVYGGGETKGLGLAFLDYQILDSKRLYISTFAMLGRFPLLRAYAPYPDELTPANKARPGANDSNFDDYIEASGTSNWWDVHLEYVLPWGQAKKSGMTTYKLHGGLLEDPPNIGDWNPFENGTSVLIAKQINRYQLYHDEGGDLSGEVHALELGYLYDHTDFPTNPSKGSSQYFAFTYNPDWLDSSADWNFIEFEGSKYFSLGENSFAKQNILALNMWLGYSPSWDVIYDEQGSSQVVNNAPFLEGATLGGMYRMRGYRSNRFHDKAVIYATAEYRMTLNYNPIEDVRYLRFLNLDWFQTVFFVEGGRVSPTFNRDVLFSDWKTDVGVSLRALAAGIVVRLDVTTSSEGTSTWIMVDHPF